LKADEADKIINMKTKNSL